MRKRVFIFRLDGPIYFECLRLDDLLDVFSEVNHVEKRPFIAEHEDGSRCIDKLVRDGYVKDYGSILKITSEGLLFRSTGGYTREFLVAKRSSASFWISIISFLIACASFVISLTR